MIETGGPIELRDQRREIGAEAPLVRSSSCGQDALLPPVPPGRDESRDRLDDEDLIRFARPNPAITVITTAIEGLGQQLIARRIRQLVQRERSHQGQRLPRKRKFTQIDATNSRGQSELVVRMTCLGKRPGVSVYAEDRWRTGAHAGPGRTGRSRPTTQIQDCRSRLGRHWESFYDATHDQMMNRAVEQGERRALAATGQRSTAGEAPPALQ